MKRFKDTKVFKFMKDKAPSILATTLDIADDFFPPAKILTALVNSAIDVPEEIKTELHSAIDEYHNTEYKDYLADVQNAREMYKETNHEMADSIAKRVIDWNLVIIMSLVAIQVLAVYYIKNEVAAVITGVIGTITGALINERSTVINFFFGSSKGGQQNSEAIRKMAQAE